MYLAKKGFIYLNFMLLSTLSMANPLPHFDVQMQNQSVKNATISFKKGEGNASLQPLLADDTLLAALQTSAKYKVYFDSIKSTDTFNIIFSGKKACTFNIGFFAPANPKVSVSGSGCRGGGYQIVDDGRTLLLYISDIGFL